jgi:hypothetical protein
MYVVIGNELADVDSSKFEKIGIFSEGVIAMPYSSRGLSLKGMPSSSHDQLEDCQNTMFLTYEAPLYSQDVERLLLEDPFVPGFIYRRKDSEDGYHFVELKYEYPLGILTLQSYFLEEVKNCMFGYQEEHETHTDVDYGLLWKEGLVQRMKS